jgi:hypothetical protein
MHILNSLVQSHFELKTDLTNSTTIMGSTSSKRQSRGNNYTIRTQDVNYRRELILSRVRQMFQKQFPTEWNTLNCTYSIDVIDLKIEAIFKQNFDPNYLFDHTSYKCFDQMIESYQVVIVKKKTASE